MALSLKIMLELSRQYYSFIILLYILNKKKKVSFCKIMVIILQILLSPTERNQVIILLTINMYNDPENHYQKC